MASKSGNSQRDDSGYQKNSENTFSLHMKEKMKMAVMFGKYSGNKNYITKAQFQDIVGKVYNSTEQFETFPFSRDLSAKPEPSSNIEQEEYLDICIELDGLIEIGETCVKAYFSVVDAFEALHHYTFFPLRY